MAMPETGVDPAPLSTGTSGKDCLRPRRWMGRMAGNDGLPCGTGECPFEHHDGEHFFVRILAISGSLRAESTNARLPRAAARLAPPGAAEFTFYDRQIAALPYFSPDLDGDGAIPPPPVAEFRRLLAEAGGILICCPEYAHGVPGAFKNALDWIVSSGEFTDKPVALFMASAWGAEQARAAPTPHAEGDGRDDDARAIDDNAAQSPGRGRKHHRPGDGGDCAGRDRGVAGDQRARTGLRIPAPNARPAGKWAGEWIVAQSPWPTAALTPAGNAPGAGPHVREF